MSQTQEKPLQVLYEDKNLLAVYKTAGIPVQADKTGDATLLDRVKAYLRKQSGKETPFCEVTHRIDRPVSGIVLLAKTHETLVGLNKLFQIKKVHKTYLAIVQPTPSEKKGRLVHWVKKIQTANLAKAFDQETPGCKEAILDYEVLQESGEQALLKIIPKTGRHHQIRVQLSKMGSPVLGDNKYGYKGPSTGWGIALHAYNLAFQHPITHVNLLIAAPFPQHPMWDTFRALEGHGE
jgi:23S rRNA pseudouridine1911/1915/1917 synthase